LDAVELGGLAPFGASVEGRPRCGSRASDPCDIRPYRLAPLTPERLAGLLAEDRRITGASE